MPHAPPSSSSRFAPELIPWNEDFVTHRYVQLDEVRLHVVEAGEGPLVVLLHGFPEFWYSWRFQIPVLVRAGFRVVAPDMRGYNLSDKPSGVRAYRVERLAADIAQLVDRLGERRAAVVGHDWGGLVAWWFAMRHPDRLSRLSVLNCPHPEHQLAMMRDREQLRRSSYMLAFQLPVLPERRLLANDGEVLRRTFRTDPVREGAFSDSDVDRYVQALSGGSAHAAINYYRALLRRSPFALRRALRPVQQPVQVIWGARDHHLGQQYARPSAALAADLRYDVIEDASHWVQVDRPAQVNARLKEFLDPLGPSRIG
ncbi:MAG: alpha/beta fold hydrolase [Nannocystaceae bacterium]